MKFFLITAFLLTVEICISPTFAQYSSDWASLDSRPVPSWYDDAKFGIMIHWGIYSVPSFGNEWFWNEWKVSYDSRFVDYMNKYYPPDFTYQEFAKDFTAELFNASQWAELFVKAGAKYVVLTTKHHEGYTLWPSKYSYSWNSVDVGPHRDLVGELSEAVRAQGLTFGAYYSLLEWFHPLYLADKATNYAQQEFVSNKVWPEMKELVETYKPDIFWSDGEWETQDTYWNSTDFIAWLYNESPVKDTIVVNDRWGVNVNCLHGGFYTCSDRYNPGTLQAHKWENAWTIDTASWAFRREAKLSEYYSVSDLLWQIASTVSCGGNILLNVGPTKDGIIDPIYEERLTQIGEWMSINGEAIYETQPWSAQNDSLSWGVWYTSKDTTVYAIVLHWTWYQNILVLGSVTDYFRETSPTVTMLGNEDDGELEWNIGEEGVNVYFLDRANVKSEWAWVLKIKPTTRKQNL